MQADRGKHRPRQFMWIVPLAIAMAGWSFTYRELLREREEAILVRAEDVLMHAIDVEEGGSNWVEIRNAKFHVLVPELHHLATGEGEIGSQARTLLRAIACYRERVPEEPSASVPFRQRIQTRTTEVLDEYRTECKAAERRRANPGDVNTAR